MSSLIDQVAHLFEKNHRPGTSRHAWRKANPGVGRLCPFTVSWASYHRYRQGAIHIALWLRDRYHIRQIRAITPAMIVAYFDARRAAGIRPNTIATEITSARRLGLYAVLERWQRVNVVPDDLTAARTSVPRYAYPQEYAPQIVAHVAGRDPLAADVLSVIDATGLRIDEAIMVLRSAIDFERGTITVKGKGGQLRTVTIADRALLDRLPNVNRPLLHGKRQAWIRHIEALTREACVALGLDPLGVHALRAGDAQRTYDAAIERGDGDRAARRVVAERLGHHRTDVTHSYVP